MEEKKEGCEALGFILEPAVVDFRAALRFGVFLSSEREARGVIEKCGALALEATEKKSDLEGPSGSGTRWGDQREK